MHKEKDKQRNLKSKRKVKQNKTNKLCGRVHQCFANWGLRGMLEFENVLECERREGDKKKKKKKLESLSLGKGRMEGLRKRVRQLLEKKGMFVTPKSFLLHENTHKSTKWNFVFC